MIDFLQERAESVGTVVGYSVRFDTKISRRTRLTFCTTGETSMETVLDICSTGRLK